MGVKHSLGLLCLAALAGLLGLVAGGDGEDGLLAGISAACYLVAVLLSALGLWRLFRYLTAG